MAGTLEVTIDAVDPEPAARFWEDALGYERRHERASFIVLGPKAGDRRPAVLVQRVKEVTPGKSRMHLDLRVDDPDAEVARLVGLGAQVAWEVDDRATGGSRWSVLTDPQGVHFCVCPARPEEND